MTRNWLRINQSEGTLQLSWQRGQAAPRTAPTVPFEHPFDTPVLEEVRWYLEEYLNFPYGLEPDRARQVEQSFQIWGEQLFELIFRSSEEARTFFQEATRAGLDHCELAVSSDDPAVLNLPWELIYSPPPQGPSGAIVGGRVSLPQQSCRASRTGRNA
ncbi:MAG: hypothetical protein QNJ46_19510 [Leptolyngbyaceae cyanobacterium MO_188.B28]|nr:hypothetical protein [Leptolyngbyaceae cyanobacterium MO_188.B28]